MKKNPKETGKKGGGSDSHILFVFSK